MVIWLGNGAHWRHIVYTRKDWNSRVRVGAQDSFLRGTVSTRGLAPLGQVANTVAGAAGVATRVRKYNNNIIITSEKRRSAGINIIGAPPTPYQSVVAR